jgi:parvulin-like peptidyl-prolyl isomerase
MTTDLQQAIPPESLQALQQLQISPTTEADIIAYLRRSFKMASVTKLAQRDATLLKFAEGLNITVADEEVQSAADEFRRKYGLFNAADMNALLSAQQMTAEDWAENLKIALVTTKLEEHLFGSSIDNHYLENREVYKRAAISQILLKDETQAQRVAQEIRQGSIHFNAAALEYSTGTLSRTSAGYVGVRFFGELRPEIAQAIAEASEGEIIGPVQTPIGYHILRVEKWFPSELTVAQRKRMLASLLKIVLRSTQITANSDGNELFSDEENYLGELSEDELSGVSGGVTPWLLGAVVFSVGGLASYNVSRNLK